MTGKQLKHGFSLVEVMMAAGILAVGFMLIVSLWPAGIKMTAMSTERTIGSVASNEAMAKIKLYDLYKGNTHPAGVCNEYTLSGATYVAIYNYGLDVADMISDTTEISDSDWPVLYQKARELIFLYPSVNVADGHKYCWSALFNKSRGQVTIFVSRIGDGNSMYPYLNLMPAPVGFVGEWTSTALPQPVLLNVAYNANFDGSVTELSINFDDPYGLGHDYGNVFKYVGKGATLVGNNSGRMLKVMDVNTGSGTLILNEGVFSPVDNSYWVIPPRMKGPDVAIDVVPMVGGRYPCAGVYQFTMN